MGIYGIAKAGLEMLTQVLASELAPFNIQVNAVAPGVVRTDFSKPFWSTPAICEQIVKAVPAGRIAETADLVPILHDVEGQRAHQRDGEKNEHRVAGRQLPPDRAEQLETSLGAAFADSDAR